MAGRTTRALGSRLLLVLLRLVQRLPLAAQAALGRALGVVLYALVPARRRIALRNLELCFADRDARWRRRVAFEHFQWLGRSLLERGLLWYASPECLKRLIHVEGDIAFAQSTGEPVMWLVPHFVGLDIAGTALSLLQTRLAASIYQTQSNAVMDAAMRAGRTRFGNAEIFARRENALPLVRAIKQGRVFFNLPDMDFGRREAEFVPFFGVPAATLVAPSKMARALRMRVQPVVAELLPGGRGYRVRCLPPWDHWPTDDPLADAAAMNRWIEDLVRANPAQYLWVHKRFKTRPPGEPKLY